MAPSSFNIIYVIAALVGGVSSINVGSFESSLSSFFQTAELFVLAVCGILFVFYLFVQLRLSQMEHDFYKAQDAHAAAFRAKASETPKNEHWERVLTLAGSPSESDWRRAIIQADALLDELLDDNGFVGENLGERLTNASSNNFATLQLAWEAHKMRNRIAHDGESFLLTERDRDTAIENYRKVFEEFEYI